MKTLRALLPLAFGLALFAATSAHADRLDATVTLGSTTAGSVAAPGAVSTVGFLVTEGTGRKLALSVKRGKGSKLEPDVRLVAPDGTVFDLAGNGGSVKASATSWSAKLPDVPQSGLWRLEVRGTRDTTGTFSSIVKGKDGFKLTGTLTIQSGGKQELTIVAGDGAALTVAASRLPGSSLNAQLAILDSNGAPVPGGPFKADTKGKLSVKGFVLPFFGNYTLRFTGMSNTAGGLKYAVTGAATKVTGAIPVADAGTSVETEPGFLTQLDGSNSKPAAGKTLTYRWTQVSGPLVSLTDPATARPSFVAPATESSIVLQLSVSEDGVRSRPATLDVTVANRPVADAGRSQAVASGAPVTLDGSGTFDRRGKGLSYSWRQIPGDTAQVTLTGVNTVTPTFTAPAGSHTLHFGLTADDGNVRSFEDVVVVAVGAGNASVADAGREQYVPRMGSVHLSGLGSLNGTAVLDAACQWTQTSGPGVQLTGADTLHPSFTAPRTVADLEFQLVVNGTAATADRVAVRVRQFETNLPAPAETVGPLNAAAGAVTLATSPATADPEGKALTYRWTQIAGAPMPISSSSAPSPSATIAAGAGLGLFCVQTNDGLQYGAPDLVSLRNTNFSAAPLAVAGANVSVAGTATATLDGSGSSRTDGGAGALTYQWTQVSGQGWFDVAQSAVAFDAAAARPQLALPSFISSLTPTRTIVMQLVVSDGTTTSRPDFVSVTFTSLPLNGKPVVTVTPSDANPTVGTTVQLAATAIDRDGDALTYRWTQVSGPSTPLAPSQDALSVSFIAGDAAVPVAFRLVANDGFEDSVPVTSTIVIDRKPVGAVVTSPVAGTPGTEVTMDAQSSADPEGSTVTYKWTQVLGTPVSIVNDEAAVIRFTAPQDAVAFRLVVNDGRQDSNPTVAVFSSSAPPTAAPVADRTVAAYGSSVNLAGNPGQGGPFTFRWRQINTFGADPIVTLENPTSATASFTVPMPASAPFGINPQATFGLTVFLGQQASNEYTVTVRFFASFNDLSQTQNTIYGIVTNNCVTCHSGTTNSTCTTGVGSGTNASGYGMATPAAFLQNSRGIASCAAGTGGPKPTPGGGGGGKTRLPAAGATGASSSGAYLLDRIKGIATPRMPASGSYLSQGDINFFQDWIDQGVQDN